MNTNENDNRPAVNNTPESIENKLLHNRIIWLKDEVNDKTANEVINKLLLLHGEDQVKDIFLYISSPGGSITAGMGIYDTMNFIGNDVVTIGVGMCASMGQFLLTAGAKGKRFLMPHARVLMHQPSGGIQGSEADVRIEAELISDMKREMAEITALQTNHSVDEILRDNEYDHWYTTKEALDYGFVDAIVNNEHELLAKLNTNAGWPDVKSTDAITATQSASDASTHTTATVNTNARTATAVDNTADTASSKHNSKTSSKRTTTSKSKTTTNNASTDNTDADTTTDGKRKTTVRKKK
jgi:ATP-dependent Clp protease protease subunit